MIMMELIHISPTAIMILKANMINTLLRYEHR